jgi:hypothetical protein
MRRVLLRRTVFGFVAFLGFTFGYVMVGAPGQERATALLTSLQPAVARLLAIGGGPESGGPDGESVRLVAAPPVQVPDELLLPPPFLGAPDSASGPDDQPGTEAQPATTPGGETATGTPGAQSPADDGSGTTETSESLVSASGSVTVGGLELDTGDLGLDGSGTSLELNLPELSLDGLSELDLTELDVELGASVAGIGVGVGVDESGASLDTPIGGVSVGTGGVTTSIEGVPDLDVELPGLLDEIEETVDELEETVGATTDETLETVDETLDDVVPPEVDEVVEDLEEDLEDLLGGLFGS